MDKNTLLTVLKAAPVTAPIFVYGERTQYMVGTLIVNIEDGIWTQIHEGIKVIEVHEDRVILR